MEGGKTIGEGNGMTRCELYEILETKIDKDHRVQLKATAHGGLAGKIKEFDATINSIKIAKVVFGILAAIFAAVGLAYIGLGSMYGHPIIFQMAIGAFAVTIAALVGYAASVIKELHYLSRELSSQDLTDLISELKQHVIGEQAPFKCGHERYKELSLQKDVADGIRAENITGKTMEEAFAWIKNSSSVDLREHDSDTKHYVAMAAGIAIFVLGISLLTAAGLSPHDYVLLQGGIGATLILAGATLALLSGRELDKREEAMDEEYAQRRLDDLRENIEHERGKHEFDSRRYQVLKGVKTLLSNPEKIVGSKRYNLFEDPIVIVEDKDDFLYIEDLNRPQTPLPTPPLINLFPPSAPTHYDMSQGNLYPTSTQINNQFSIKGDY